MSQASAGARRRLWRDDPHECWWCHTPFATPEDATIDHLIPVARGGTYAATNTVLACSSCNQARGHRRWCALCGFRIRRWHAAGWVERRHVFHHDCVRHVLRALTWTATGAAAATSRCCSADPQTSSCKVTAPT